MGRSTLIALFLLSACSRGLPQAKDRPDGGPVCLAGSHTCLPGSRCVGNLCVATCSGGTACAAGTYCGGPTFPNDVCAPIVAAGCTTFSDCPFPQDCFLGRCAAQEVSADGGVQPCTPATLPDDCAPDAVCTVILAGSPPVCLGLPPCGADGACAGLSLSRACNMLADGGQIIPGKGRICLTEQCLGEEDCTPGVHCAHLNPAVTFGKCQQGSFGDPCLADRPDCNGNLSCIGAGVLADGGPQTGRCECADGGINPDGGCD
jgi:hypothetical protein